MVILTTGALRIGLPYGRAAPRAIQRPGDAARHAFAGSIDWAPPARPGPLARCRSVGGQPRGKDIVAPRFNVR